MSSKKNIALLIEFDGQAFYGYQYQDDLKTVQGALEKAWHEGLAKPPEAEKVRPVGCSRTDSGVSSKHHVVNFYDYCEIPVDKLPFVLNTKLPGEAAVRAAKEVDENFSSRYDCIAKVYKYRLFFSRHRSPVRAKGFLHIPGRYDLKKIEEILPLLIGEKDYKAFSDVSKQKVKSTIRRIDFLRLEEELEGVDREDERKIVLTVGGSGFLYHMVRIIAGTAAYAALGKITAETVKEALNTQNRKKLAKTLPPQGLSLEKVYYEKTLFGDDSFEDYFKRCESAHEERKDNRIRLLSFAALSGKEIIKSKQAYNARLEAARREYFMTAAEHERN